MIEAVNNLDTAKVLPAVLVAGAAHAFNVSSTQTTTASSKASEGLLKEILDQLRKTPAQTSALVDATVGDIVIVLNDREVGRAQNRNSLDNKRSQTGGVATPLGPI
jgi:hypothetical protein